MRTIVVRTLALVVVLVALGIGLASTPRARPIRLMPLGDSNTAAPGELSYRASLWRELRQDGYDVDFVGSAWERPRDYDRDHEGHGGWTAHEIFYGLPGHPDLGSIRDWARDHRPEVVVLLLGTNDLARAQCVLRALCCDDTTQRKDYQAARAEAIASIVAIIDVLRSHRPDVRIAVGQIPPNIFVEPEEIVRFNESLLAELSLTRDSRVSPIRFFDVHDGMVWKLKDPDSDTKDGVHFSAKGAKRAAERIRRVLVDDGLLDAR